MRRMLRGTQGGGFEVEVPAMNATKGGECYKGNQSGKEAMDRPK
jgi:hypothetical protein